MGVSRDCPFFPVPLIIPGTGKATDFKLGQYIQRVHPNKSAGKKFREKGTWAYPGTAHFFGYPLLSQEQEKLQISNLASTFRGSIRTVKNFGEKGVWAYPGTAQIFWVPPLISGTEKATNFKFCKHIYRLNRNKSPLKMLRKVAMGVVRDSQIFSGHPYIVRIARSSLR